MPGEPPRSPSRTLKRRIQAAAVAAALVALVGACVGERATGHYYFPRQEAYGRTSTCPEVRMPPLRDGGVSPDAARCSYADANGARVTHLAGKVLAESGPATPGTGVAGVTVSVHTLAGPSFPDPYAPGPRVAQGVTDAQGNYSVRGMFLPSEYAIVVVEPGGELLALRIVRVAAEATGTVRDLHVQIPIDPRLKADAAQPPVPRRDGRLQPGQAPPPPPPTIPPVSPAEPPASLSVTPPTPAAIPGPPPAGVRMRPPEPAPTPTPRP